nr:unnamed protein product [Callosobruchus analis]
MSDNKQPKFRLARLYKVAAAIAKEYSEGFGSIKQLVRNMSDLSEDPDIAEVTPVLHENPPLLPAHSKQAAKAIGVLLFFSFLMFSLPFASFFATKYLLQDYFHVTGFTNTVWSVIASVVTVNCIIVVYAYLAYIEPDLDEQGNVIQDGAERPKKE